MNDSCDVVLQSLELVDGVEWSAMEHNVADCTIVDPGKDQTTCKRLCKVRNQ